AEMSTKELGVGDQVLRRVGAQAGRRIACVRPAAAAVSLVEEHRQVGVRVEERSPPRRAARAGTAVEGNRRLAVGVAAELPVDEIAVADLEEATVEGLDFRVPGHVTPILLSNLGAHERLGDSGGGGKR